MRSVEGKVRHATYQNDQNPRWRTGGNLGIPCEWEEVLFQTKFLAVVSSLGYLSIKKFSSLLGSKIPRGWTCHLTYRQGSAELGISERPKKCFTTNRNPQKMLSEKQNPKKYPQKHYSFRKSQA